MAKYPMFTLKDKEAFMGLYKKYLDYQLEEMDRIFEELPTDVIERIFSGTTIHKKENRLFIDFGFNHIRNVAKELEVYYRYHTDGKLVDFLSNYGHKVNVNKIGVRE